VRGLVEKTRKAPNGATRHVLVCGELAPCLWTQGKVDAALTVEELWDAALPPVWHKHTVRVFIHVLRAVRDQRMFQNICSVHSIVVPDNCNAQLG